MTARRKLPTLTWTDILLYYAVVTGVSTAGTFLAYGPLSSDAWQCWSGSTAWIRDTARVVVYSALIVFALSALGVISGERHERQGIRHLFPVTRRGWFAISAITLALGSFIVFLGGRSFADALPRRCPDVDATFEQIWLPYVPYFLYVLGFWIGMLWPLLYCLILNIQHDRHWRSRTLARFESIAPAAQKAQSAEQRRLEATAQFEHLIVAHQAYVSELKSIAERYFPILIVLILALLYEQLTPSHKTITELAVELSKVVVWLFAGPVLTIFVAVVALGYQRSISKIEQRLAVLTEEIHAGGNMSSLLDRVMSARRDFLWNRSAGAFVLTVVKSANISVPLLLALSSYVINALSGGSWEEIFFPRALVDLVETWFQGQSPGQTGEPGRTMPP